jgi:hypothetical protein
VVVAEIYILGESRMLRSMNTALLLSVAIFTSACSTLLRGTEEEVSVHTHPAGADIQFSNGQTCKSPCVITAARNYPLQITAAKQNCQTQHAFIAPVLGTTGILTGGVVDYMSGAVYDLKPNPLMINLTCDEKGKPPTAP